MKNAFALLLLLFINSSFSQELPPINFFTPKEYKAENQNWSISQGLDKNIYIANNIGLLEFNGARWKLYPSPNETILRSVKAIGEKIYSGSYMDFGYWKKNNFGIIIIKNDAMTSIEINKNHNFGIQEFELLDFEQSSIDCMN